MKFNCVIYICPLIIAIAAATVQLTYTNFGFCNPKAWMLKNTTVKWVNDTKIITSDIIYKQEYNSTIYKIHIMINSCNNHTECDNEPVTWIESINCNNETLSKSDETACLITDELGKLEKEEERLSNRYGKFGKKLLSEMVLCIESDDFESFASFESLEKK